MSRNPTISTSCATLSASPRGGNAHPATLIGFIEPRTAVHPPRENGSKAVGMPSWRQHHGKLRNIRVDLQGVGALVRLLTIMPFGHHDARIICGYLLADRSWDLWRRRCRNAACTGAWPSRGCQSMPPDIPGSIIRSTQSHAPRGQEI